jgi:hypothetical protein
MLIRALLGALAVLTLVIVASALHRMDLYADTYGLTRLRVLVALCEFWLGVVFVMVLVAGDPVRASWLPRAVVVAGVLALLGLAAANPDGLIADRKHHPVRADRRIDTAYLSGLSADAVPALERLTGTSATASSDRSPGSSIGTRTTGGAGTTGASTRARSSPPNPSGSRATAESLTSGARRSDCRACVATRPGREAGAYPCGIGRGRARRPAATGPAPTSRSRTPVGEALVKGLVRAQLALACGCRWWWWPGWARCRCCSRSRPAVAEVKVFGINLPWLLLGVLSFPFLTCVGWAYVRWAERNESDFTAVIRRPER